MLMMIQSNSLLSFTRCRKLILPIGIVICILFFSAAGAPPRKDIEEKAKTIDMIEKVRVRLLLFDVVVEDREGNPVSNLSKDDFHLFIDGTEKPISTFEEHCESTLHLVDKTMAAEAEKKEEAPATEDLGTDFIDIEPRYIIFYFDGAHLSMGGRIRAIDATEKYIRENMTLNDNIMIAVYANRLRVLQYFTNDRQELLETIQKIKDDESLLDDYGSSEFARTASFRQTEYQYKRPFQVPENCPEAVGYAFENYLNTQRALNGLQSSFTMLEPIKAKKAFIYYGDTLRDHPGLLYILMAPGCLNDNLELLSYERSLNIEPQIRELVSEANSIRVSFYAVDTLGLTAPGERLEEGAVLNALSSLSIDTGGAVLKGSNDLTRFISVMEKDFSCYYTIGFSPEERADGKKHALKITLDVPRLKVRSKTVFTDFTEDEKKSRQLLSAFVMPQLFQDIKLKADLFPLKPYKGSWESMIQLALDLEEIKRLKLPFKEIRFAYTLFAEGKIMKEIDQLVKLTMKEENILNFPYWVVHQEKCQLKPGEYELVAVVKDILTEQIGAINRKFIIPEIQDRDLTIGSIMIKGSHPTEVLLRNKEKHEKIDHSHFIIRPNRQFSISEVIVLVTPICSYHKSFHEGYPEISVKRRLLKEDELLIEFNALPLQDPPDFSSGCYSIIDIIEPNTLEEGIYAFEIELSGADNHQKVVETFSLH
jgi:VWFA-related protein